MRNMIDYEGQVAVVTGAGRGLGRLYALELARRGAAVVVNDLGGTMHGEGADAAVADQVVTEIEQAGGRAVASYDSVDSPEGGQAIVDAAVEAFGRLDAVVSNAGIFNSIPFDQLSPDDWRRMLQVHLDGGFYLSQPAFKVMAKQKYGRFVFISSSAGNFRPADGSALRGRQDRPCRTVQRHRDRGCGTRNSRQYRATDRLFADGHGDRR
jgi:NAD(P)-dependent dehydrogenase (short-subunit alcohol dehydrogenase family)